MLCSRQGRGVRTYQHSLRALAGFVEKHLPPAEQVKFPFCLTIAEKFPLQEKGHISSTLLAHLTVCTLL